MELNQETIDLLFEQHSFEIGDGKVVRIMYKDDFAQTAAEIRRQTLAWPTEITPALHEVLGKPNYWCAQIAKVLRKSGQDIPRKSENEQAAVLFWLAGLALKHGDGWKGVFLSELNVMLEQAQPNGEKE